MSEVGYPEPGGEEFTGGHSGSDTSTARAQGEARDGTKQERERRTLGYATVMGRYGITVADLRDVTEWHHGQASSVLSTLHKAGKLARLASSRDRCKVYVLPEHVFGRTTEKHGRTRSGVLTPPEKAALERLERLLKPRLGGAWELLPAEDVQTLTEALRRLS